MIYDCLPSLSPHSASRNIHGGARCSKVAHVLLSATADENDLASTSSSSMADTTVQSKSAGGEAARGFGTPRAKTGTVNKRLMNVIDAELKVRK